MNHQKMYETYRTPSGDLRYRSRIRVRGKRTSKSFSTLSDLKFWLGKMENLRRSERLGEETFLPTTFEIAARRWLTEYVDIHMAPSMRVCNREIMETQLIPRVREQNIGDLKLAEWEAVLVELTREREWSSATFNRRRSLLMSFTIGASKRI